MEMLERCPGCSVTREAEPVRIESGLKKSRACAHCGYDGPFPAPEAAPAAAAPHRDSMPSFAGARAKLATATQDLFRLSGHYSIPVEPPAPEPPPPPEPVLDSTRKAESSIMFSLEALMKANAPASKREAPAEEVSEQLWNMQAATPLFGTAQDQALLTTPLKVEPSPSMDSMTLPSHAPTGRRWWPLALAAGAGLALAAGGVWFFRAPQSAAPAIATPSAAEQAALAAQPPAAQLPPVPEPTPEVTPAAQPASPTQPTEPVAGAAPAEPSAEGAPAEPGTEVAPAAPPGAPAAAAAKPEAPKSTRKPLPRASAPSSQKPFDKGAAKAALATATSAAAGCGQGGAPGKGKIQVTFAPSGKVSDATLVEGPFAGTAAGKCALRHFRAARVPAFSGAPVTVAKSFKVD
jgi:hypothetical protein